MEKNRIMEIVITNRKINVVFERGENKVYETGFPVVGVALVEDMAGQKSIKIMYTGDKGLVEYLEDDKEGFKELRPESRGINRVV